MMRTAPTTGGVIGIDLGTNKAAIVQIKNLDEVVYNSWLLDSSEYKTPDERFAMNLNHIIYKVRELRPILTVCEYPFNIRGHGAILIEMFGVIHYHAIRYGLEFLQLSQSRLKKYATGKGGVEKSEMRMQLYKEYGIDLNEDQTDAFWIAHFGYSWLHGSDKKYRQESVDAMRKVKSKGKGKKK